MSRRRILFVVLLAVPAVYLAAFWYGAHREAGNLEAIEQQLEEEGRLSAALPARIRLETKFKRAWDWGPKGEIITVGQRLSELGAYLDNGKLYSLSGIEVRFYIVDWANWDSGYHRRIRAEMLRQKEKEEGEIEQLRKQYEVIALYPPWDGPRS